MSMSLPRPATNGLKVLWDQPQWHARLLALAIATLLLGVAYAPNFGELWTKWTTDPNYSHGILVIPIALLILWQRLSDQAPDSAAITPAAAWVSWFLLAVVLAARVVAYERNLQWTESATIVPAVACLTWTFGGWPLLQRAWPAIIFLVFMLPLPDAVNNLVSLPLQRIAATGSCFLLQLSGLWSIQTGNVINLKTPHGLEKLDVALACSGLRMLMMLAATVAATIILIPLPTWKRIILLLSAVPIALLANMIRIVVTGWCYARAWNPQTAHDWSGYLMMVVGLLLVWLELTVLAWLVPEEHAEEERPIIVGLLDRKSEKKPGQALPEV
jgi:exosortase